MSKPILGADADQEPPAVWPYFEEMSFLKDGLKLPKTELPDNDDWFEGLKSLILPIELPQFELPPSSASTDMCWIEEAKKQRQKTLDDITRRIELYQKELYQRQQELLASIYGNKLQRAFHSG